jgi:hypothetical protein
MFKPTDMIRLQPGIIVSPIMKTCAYRLDDHVGDLKKGEIGLILQVQVVPELNAPQAWWYQILKGRITGWIKGELIEKV